jgi:hypothetical protein
VFFGALQSSSRFLQSDGSEELYFSSFGFWIFIGRVQRSRGDCLWDFMVVTSSDVILLAHSTFGVLGILSALWVFVETLNAREENAGRIRKAAFIAALCMVVTWVLGGYWYVHFYPLDRALILKGPWPFAHTLFMETKEHINCQQKLLTLESVPGFRLSSESDDEIRTTSASGGRVYRYPAALRAPWAFASPHSLPC